jgi:hypothetical protein
MTLELDEPAGGETIKFIQTDGHGAWSASIEGTRALVGGKDEADVSVRGTASDLILLLWRRVGTSAVEIEGDRSVLDKFLSWREPE